MGQPHGSLQLPSHQESSVSRALAQPVQSTHRRELAVVSGIPHKPAGPGSGILTTGSSQPGDGARRAGRGVTCGGLCCKEAGAPGSAGGDSSHHWRLSRATVIGQSR